ncbi:NAD(P)-binding protein [Nocardioides sp. TRM66260-LWL]|uniref:NAD(P)/FAD-dependent oxidoreductase n=1 Tax=Nocardioides sp. TRM66260-LWL TaxID=2874478 RepID=UPI001CC371DA|nr:NAD(P)-binding protein [Nocardioides sp. TRM66260-LWL]MBZ5735843.1 NAD(P)-binding protein [Nocardioides sp. TRM66260-LWL]
MEAPSPDLPVIVVGAGIAGVACSRALQAADVPVRLIDRGRRLGGRMASRRLEGRPVDMGASYFTVSDPRFAAVVEDWRARGVAREWTDTFTVLEPGSAPTTKTGPMRWSSPTGLRSVVEDLAAPLEVEQAAVEQVTLAPDGTLSVDDRPASAVVLAMTDSQARTLLGAGLEADAGVLTRASEPVIATVAWWAERLWDLDGAFVNGDPDLAWIADDGARRGDGAPCLVAHSTPELAQPHLADPQQAGPPMVAALRRLLDLPEPAGTYVHRWSQARPIGEREAPFHLSEAGLGVCGDGWGPVSKVEGAWLSGTALGEAIAARHA